MNKNYKTIIIFSIFFILAGGFFISKYLTLKNKSNIKNLANNIYDLSISMPTHNNRTEKKSEDISYNIIDNNFSEINEDSNSQDLSQKEDEIIESETNISTYNTTSPQKDTSNIKSEEVLPSPPSSSDYTITEEQPYFEKIEEPIFTTKEEDKKEELDISNNLSQQEKITQETNDNQPTSKIQEEKYIKNEEMIEKIKNIITNNESDFMKKYGYEIIVDSSIKELTNQFTFTENRVKSSLQHKFGTIRIYAEDLYINSEFIMTECYII